MGLLIKSPAPVLVLEYEGETWVGSNGKEALQELVDANYTEVTDDVIRATTERLDNSGMDPGQDSDGKFTKQTSRAV